MSPGTRGTRRHPRNSTFPKGTGRGVTSHGTTANDRLCRRLPVKRAEVRWYRLRQTNGDPLVLTRDSIIPFLGEVTVAPVTTRIRDIPSEVLLSARTDCRRVCRQLRPRPAQRGKLGALITTLSPGVMDQVAPRFASRLTWADRRARCRATAARGAKLARMRKGRAGDVPVAWIEPGGPSGGRWSSGCRASAAQGEDGAPRGGVRRAAYDPYQHGSMIETPSARPLKGNPLASFWPILARAEDVHVRLGPELGVDERVGMGGSRLARRLRGGAAIDRMESVAALLAAAPSSHMIGPGGLPAGNPLTNLDAYRHAGDLPERGARPAGAPRSVARPCARRSTPAARSGRRRRGRRPEYEEAQWPRRHPSNEAGATGYIGTPYR